MIEERVVLEGSVNISVVSGVSGSIIKTSPMATITLNGKVQPLASSVAKKLRTAGIDAVCGQEIDATLHGKLLINLFNAVNALSGTSLTETLCSPGQRTVIKLCIAEALDVYKGEYPASYLSYFVFIYVPHMTRIKLLFTIAQPKAKLSKP
jgi:2-dehydropantoate 2-reductase